MASPATAQPTTIHGQFQKRKIVSASPIPRVFSQPARLASAVIRETLATGGRACRPLIAREGLGATLIEPALSHLQQRGAVLRLEHQLRALRFAAERVEALDFGGETISLASDDAVILAVPPYVAAPLVSLSVSGQLLPGFSGTAARFYRLQLDA